jgi:hypothetical protein
MTLRKECKMCGFVNTPTFEQAEWWWRKKHVGSWRWHIKVTLEKIAIFFEKWADKW